jgi:hypothetical protein
MRHFRAPLDLETNCNANAFAAEHGWTVASEHVYAHEAVSGADVKKLKGRQPLLDVIRRGGAPFQILIIREHLDSVAAMVTKPSAS